MRTQQHCRVPRRPEGQARQADASPRLRLSPGKASLECEKFERGCWDTAAWTYRTGPCCAPGQERTARVYWLVAGEPYRSSQRQSRGKSIFQHLATLPLSITRRLGPFDHSTRVIDFHPLHTQAGRELTVRFAFLFCSPRLSSAITRRKTSTIAPPSPNKLQPSYGKHPPPLKGPGLTHAWLALPCDLPLHPCHRCSHRAALAARPISATARKRARDAARIHWLEATPVHPAPAIAERRPRVPIYTAELVVCQRLGSLDTTLDGNLTS
jgi:hypothetical protein